jgi:hypothetical protein
VPKRKYYKENAEALVVADKVNGLEVNDGKTKYTAMSQDQNEGQCHNIKIVNSSFERMEQLKYLGTNLSYQISFQEEIKSRLN